MKITNKYNLPEPYYRSCLMDKYPRHGWDTFSVTELNKGIKEIILTRRHWAELEQDCSDMIWMIFGNAVHSIMEGHDGDNELAEQRVSMELNCGRHGLRKVSGGFDLYNSETQIITDYKSTGVFSYKMKVKEGHTSDWAKQLRLYWLLLAKAGFPVKDIRNTVFLKDWSKTQARRDREYPQKPILNIDYNYKGHFNSEVASYMEAALVEKITTILDYKDAPENEIPDCTPEQRWLRDEKWAIHKEGRKSAVKLHDSKFMAESHLENLPKGHYIEHRPGVNVKCEDYCTAAPHCSFYKEMMGIVDVPMKEVVNG